MSTQTPPLIFNPSFIEVGAGVPPPFLKYPRIMPPLARKETYIEDHRNIYRILKIEFALLLNKYAPEKRLKGFK